MATRPLGWGHPNLEPAFAPAQWGHTNPEAGATTTRNNQRGETVSGLMSFFHHTGGPASSYLRTSAISVFDGGDEFASALAGDGESDRGAEVGRAQRTGGLGGVEDGLAVKGVDRALQAQFSLNVAGVSGDR